MILHAAPVPSLSLILMNIYLKLKDVHFRSTRFFFKRSSSKEVNSI
jgi:hypothetical protein